MTKKSAFTLIEVLVVITIIGVLTSILVLNFQGVKEKQEIALLADKSLAMMQQAKADVRSGKIVTNEDGSTQYLCEGALFMVGAQPQYVTMPFLSSGDCDFSSQTLENYGMDSGASYVGTLEVDGTQPDSLLALFVPPSGTLQLFSEEGVTLYSGDAQVRFESATYAVDETQIATVLQLSQSSGFAQLVLLDPNADAE